MADAHPPARRADAERNRARIMAVAREALATSSDVSLHAVAKKAGVGQGTLYRHFPTRDDLITAVYRQDVAELVEAADALLVAHDPWQALTRWLDQLAAFGRVKHGTADVLQAATRSALSTEHYNPVVEAIARLLGACRDAGLVRTDVDAEELLLLVAFLWRDEQGAEWEQRSRRMLSVVLDGLRA